MNKKGDERVLSLYWFVMFVIISIGVVSGVYLFFSNQIDVRGAEASILGDRIVGCLVQNGILNEKLLEEMNSDNFEEKCRLILKDDSLEAYKDKSQFYIEVNADGKEFAVGDGSFKAFCGQEESKRNIPICVDKILIILNEDNEFKEFNILVAVRKVEQNAI